MKQRLVLPLVCLVALVLLTGCVKGLDGQNALANITPTPESTEAPTETPEPQVGIPNPVMEVQSYEELLKAVPGVMLSDAPTGAEQVSYCYINGEPVIAQIEFVFDKNEYTYRAAAASAYAQPDISGVYEDLSNTAQFEVQGNVTAGGEYTLHYATGETKGLASWYYEPTKCQYTLYTPTGCDVTRDIEEVVDQLLPITKDASGNPIGGPVNTPAPLIEEGTITGKVVEIHDNDILINTDNGNTLQFLLTHVATVEARVDDTVEIVYSGNVIDAPEVISIVVTKTAPVKQQIFGTVIQYSSSSVFVQTTTVNIYGFVINGDTAFTGLSQSLKADNTVTVTYSGELASGPVALEIETTAVSAKPEPTAKPDPVNKSLKGQVSSLTSKKVTINTDSGHTYTFERDGSTVMAGDYALEVGSRIKVHYDGYASESPHAKRIDVLAPPDPTPPSPVRRTIAGTVTVQAGNALSVLADSGRQYSFLLRSPSVEGAGGVGDRVTVTFTDDGYGNYNVTRIVYEMPVVYGPGPVIDSPDNDNPNIGTGALPQVDEPAIGEGAIPEGSGPAIGEGAVIVG